MSNNSQEEKMFELIKEKYKGLVNDPSGYKKDGEPFLYYEECFAEANAIVVERYRNLQLLDRYQKIEELSINIVSIGANMISRITTKGCKEILKISGIMMILGDSRQKETIQSEYIHKKISLILNANINTIIMENKVGGDSDFYYGEDFFNTFDLLINLYLAFGKKEFLSETVKYMKKIAAGEVVFSLKMLPRLGVYDEYIRTLFNTEWSPPKIALEFPAPTNTNTTPASSTKSEGCYIATTVYGTYSHPQVMILRNYRDFYLERRKWGKVFISVYYKFSPYFARRLEGKNKINGLIKKALDFFIQHFIRDVF